MQKGKVIRACSLAQLCMSPNLNTDLTKIIIKLCWEMRGGCGGVLVKQSRWGSGSPDSFVDCRGAYPHHGRSRATSIMSAHMNLEIDAPKEFLLVATGTYITGWGWGAQVNPHHPEWEFNRSCLKLKHQEVAIKVC